MKTVMLKNIVISSILAASTCFAMLGPANAASNHTEQHQKNEITATKNNAAKHKVIKPQTKTSQKVQQKVNTNNSQNYKSNKTSKVSQKSKAVTPKKNTTHQTSKSKKVVAEQKAKNAQQDKHRKG